MWTTASFHVGSFEVLDMPWRTGDVVADQFEIRGRLGGGRTSSVWEAHDRALGRPVALKVSHDHEYGRRILTREARALTSVNHPGLPLVYSIGSHLGSAFLAFERLVGVRLEHHAVPETEALRVLIGVAEVLAAIHDAGMAHHDVCAANVMLCAHERVVLLGLGTTIDGDPLDLRAFGELAEELLGADIPEELARPESLDAALCELHARRAAPRGSSPRWRAPHL